MAQIDKSKHKKEWRELYDRIKGVLQRFGEDEAVGSDYFLVDDIIEPNTHLLEIHKLDMLRPEVMSSAQTCADRISQLAGEGLRDFSGRRNHHQCREWATSP